MKLGRLHLSTLPPVVKPRRAHFFSEVHPRLYRAVTSLFVKSPLIVLALVLISFIYREIARKNYDFAIDWMRDSGVLRIITSLDDGNWWQTEGIYLLVLLICIIILVYVLYLVLWKLAFPDYFIRYHTSDVYDGRLYWSDKNALVTLWDRFYRSPERLTIKYWIHQRMWPLHLTLLETTPGERFEKVGTYRIVVRERRVRRVVSRMRKGLHLTTIDDLYQGIDVPSTYVRGEFARRMEEMLDATVKASYGNPEVRVDVVRGGASLIRPEFKEEILNARKSPQQP
jgi:hypothetical protein